MGPLIILCVVLACITLCVWLGPSAEDLETDFQKAHDEYLRTRIWFVGAEATENCLIVQIAKGNNESICRRVLVPWTYTQRLQAATRKQRADFRIQGRGAGLHWPQLDEDVSAAGVWRDFISTQPEDAPSQVASGR